jgi:uncharacterized phage-associated protein
MITAHDVARYILDECGPMTAMKLQKLTYYSQAWSLVWDDAPLFDNRIEAWANGPVVTDLYQLHRGKFEVSSWPAGDTRNISQISKETINAVLAAYSKFSALDLSNLTHNEKPWIDARAGLGLNERGDSEITPESMAEFYATLYQSMQVTN